MFGLFGMTDESPMAKKKPEPPPKRPGRPKTPEGPKEARYAMRASKKWYDWLVKFSNALGVDKTIVVREGVKELAKIKKFEPPPEE
jgi:hypothetical protein